MTEGALPAFHQQQQAAAQRGAGDWSNYQPPSAVLSAIAASAPRPPGERDCMDATLIS